MPSSEFSPRTVILGFAAFILVTLAMIVFIEWVGTDTLRDFIAGAGPLAPLAYIGLKATTYVFAPLSSGPVQLTAGILFGLVPGTLYTIVGEVLGGTISFLIARKLGRPVVRRFVGADGMNRVDRFVNQLGGWRALIYARLFLFSIYDFISYAAGFSQAVTLRQYVIVSFFVGLIPTFLFVVAGVSLTEDRRLLIVIYIAVGLLSILPFALKRLRRRQQSTAST